MTCRLADIRTALALVTLYVTLTPIAVRADPLQAQRDQAACISDAFSVCGQFIPDRERVGACLVANRARISPACREAIKRFHPRTTSGPNADTLAKR